MTEERLVLETSGLCKSFGGVRAVKDVNLQVRTGCITALIGPNGAGKTTVFNLITSMFPVTSGTIRLHDQRGTQVSLTGRRVLLSLSSLMVSTSLRFSGDMFLPNVISYVFCSFSFSLLDNIG